VDKVNSVRLPLAELKTESIIDTRTRVLLLAIRQALIIALGALEEYLGMERSIIPKHKRQ